MHLKKLQTQKAHLQYYIEYYAQPTPQGIPRLNYMNMYGTNCSIKYLTTLPKTLLFIAESRYNNS